MYRYVLHFNAHQQYRALKGLGRLVKFEFLLHHLDQMELHQRIQKQLPAIWLGCY
ncbi:hypothetical protein FDY95_22715 [Hymenobacter jeollabukensis]|uniref:Uncharacterized protein n=1 Tax=Hymenobacter jeollabukensis TaxID=2025313 RepID=A0A5R8WJP9_9BACT|nr:hypothetical protein FDY95_22715 [Hymenobacter jeollabukensis]